MKRARIDWATVRNRLRVSEAALEAALTPNPSSIEDAYRRRAVRLAKVQTESKPRSASLTVLVFHLAQERYAVDIKELAEVLRLGGCAPVPGAPKYVLGVINLRGEIRAVVDLGTMLNHSERENTGSGFVLILRRSGRRIGLKVDSIESIRDIQADELTPQAQGNLIRRLTSGTLTLLSVDAVLAEILSKEESLTT